MTHVITCHHHSNHPHCFPQEDHFQNSHWLFLHLNPKISAIILCMHFLKIVNHGFEVISKNNSDHNYIDFSTVNN